MDHREQIRDAIHAAGLTAPGTIIHDGKLHRFTPCGTRRDDAGWYVPHGHLFAAGVHSDLRRDIAQCLRVDIGGQLLLAEEHLHCEHIFAKHAPRTVKLHGGRRATSSADEKAPVIPQVCASCNGSGQDPGNNQVCTRCTGTGWEPFDD